MVMLFRISETTHQHGDHTGGIKALREEFGDVPVMNPGGVDDAAAASAESVVGDCPQSAALGGRPPPWANTACQGDEDPAAALEQLAISRF